LLISFFNLISVRIVQQGAARVASSVLTRTAQVGATATRGLATLRSSNLSLGLVRPCELHVLLLLIAGEVVGASLLLSKISKMSKFLSLAKIYQNPYTSKLL
jgi:hypothetical protein